MRQTKFWTSLSLWMRSNPPKIFLKRRNTHTLYSVIALTLFPSNIWQTGMLAWGKERKVTHTHTKSWLLGLLSDQKIKSKCLLRVDGVHGVARAEEATIAAVALVDEGVAASAALDHSIKVPGGSLGGVTHEAFILKQGMRQMFS